MAYCSGRLIGKPAGRNTSWLALHTGLVAAFAAAVFVTGCDAPPQPAPPDGEHSLLVEETPFELAINFAGRIAPGERIDIAAPFDGTVDQINFAYGEKVTAGALLLELGDVEIERARSEAEATWLRADQAAQRLANWEQGPEMSRAVRALSTAEAELQDTRRKLEESRALLDRGLVPRSEYDALLQQQRARRMRVEQTREELEATRRRAGDADMRVAILERRVARSRLEALSAAAAQATIRAPVNGVIVQAQSGEAGRSEPLHVGSRVTAGQSLGVIASTEGLDVTFQLDEGDVNAIRPGQPVSVTGPGFSGITLDGRIYRIAGQADTGPGDAKATFTASARLDPLPAEAARAIRVGMTANVAVIVHRNPSAIVVPPQAVEGAGVDAWVLVRADPGGDLLRKPIILGQSGPDGVEIVSGLRAGDRVVWKAAN